MIWTKVVKPSDIYTSEAVIKTTLLKSGYRIVDFRPPMAKEELFISASDGLCIVSIPTQGNSPRFIVEKDTPHIQWWE